MVKDSFLYILSFTKEVAGEKGSKFALKPKNTYIVKGLKQVRVIKGGYRVFIHKKAKKVYAYFTLRANSWNPFEDLRKNFINGTGDIDLENAYFHRVIVKDKESNAYQYMYLDVRFPFTNRL